MILPGDFYRDCMGHPCLCLGNIGPDGEQDLDDVSGVSLLDGSQPRSCSIRHCNPERLTLAEVQTIRQLPAPGRVNGFVIGYWAADLTPKEQP